MISVWMTWIRPHLRLLLFVLFSALLVAFLYFNPLRITISPLLEARAHEQLEQVKRDNELSLFITDGCSGSVSEGWIEGVELFSDLSTEFDARYQEAAVIPFESACIEQDRAYHTGEGGYVGRLQADNDLRTAIINYGVSHTNDIKERTGLASDEQAIYLYETIAEAVYRGVRLGGAPCTGKSYAWGYGYNNSSC